MELFLHLFPSIKILTLQLQFLYEFYVNLRLQYIFNLQTNTSKNACLIL